MKDFNSCPKCGFPWAHHRVDDDGVAICDPEAVHELENAQAGAQFASLLLEGLQKRDKEFLRPKS